MSKVRIVDMPASTAQGYEWRWHSEDRTAASARGFKLFYECVADARAHGHSVKFGASPPELARLAVVRRQ